MSTQADEVDQDEQVDVREQVDALEALDPENPFEVPGLAELVFATRDLGVANGRIRLSTARHLGVTVTDVIALVHLQANGSMSQRELAEAIGLSPSAVTVMVDRLEPHGLMTRVPDPRDRRRTLVQVYSPAEDPLGLYRAMARPFLRLDADDRREATRLLRLLTEVVHESAAAVDALPRAGGSTASGA